MSIKKNLVKATTSATGTGTLTLAAMTGWAPFSAAYADGQVVPYAIENGDNKEVGLGTVSGNTLARTTVLATLVAGVYDDTAPVAITLSGNSTVHSGPLAELFTASEISGLGTSALADLGTGPTQVPTNADVAVAIESLTVTSLAALKALTAGTQQTVYMTGRASAGDGGQGVFQWFAGDQSANVSADPLGGVWVAPDSAQSGVEGAWARQFSHQFIDPRWFGAVFDGVTDAAPAVRAALDFAGWLGGGVVTICGECYAASIDPAPIGNPSGNGLPHVFRLKHDNVYVHLINRARLRTNLSARLFAVGGWWDDDIHNRPVYAFPDNAVFYEGDTSVTLGTPADAANFQPGDWAYVRTGQVLGGGNIQQPYAEWVKVLSVNAVSGVLVLDRPLHGQYAKENYPLNHNYNGQPAPFGVSNGSRPTKCVVENFGVYGNGTIESTGNLPVLAGNQCINFYEGGLGGTLTVRAKGDHHSAGWSYSLFENIDVFLTDITASRYALTMDKGNVGSIFRNFNVYASGSTAVHLHEGAQATLEGFRIFNNVDTGGGQISIRARARGIVLRNIDIHGVSGDSSAPGVYADPSTEGFNVIHGVRVFAKNGAFGSVAINGAWDVRDVKSDRLILSDFDKSSHPEGALHLPATAFASYGGTPTLSVISITNTAWLLGANALDTIGVHLTLPEDTTTVSIDVYWCATTAAEGDVRFFSYILQWDEGDDVSTNVAQYNVTPVVAASSGAFSLVTTSMATSGVLSRPFSGLVLQRDGAHAADTYPDNVAILAVRVRRAS